MPALLPRTISDPKCGRPIPSRPRPDPKRPQTQCPDNPRGGSSSVDLADVILWIIPIAGIAAVLFAGYLARDVLRRDTGTDAMRDVASTIHEGAVAFIRRQYTTIGLLAVVGAVVIGVIIFFVETQ